MSRKPIRRPHGPINQAFSRMWWDEAAGKVRFEKIEPEDVYITARDLSIHLTEQERIDMRQPGATA